MMLPVIIWQKDSLGAIFINQGKIGRHKGTTDLPEMFMLSTQIVLDPGFKSPPGLILGERIDQFCMKKAFAQGHHILLPLIFFSNTYLINFLSHQFLTFDITTKLMLVLKSQFKSVWISNHKWPLQISSDLARKLYVF